jgi:hypothetical protein
MRIPFALLAASVWLPGALATTLVVNPALKTASDDNPGTEAKPLLTIARAAALVQAGDVVRIYPGVYREAVVIKQSGTAEKPIRFEAVPGAAVVLTGADRILGWRREPGEGNVFSTEWPNRLSRTHPDDDYHLITGRAEQVFVQGYLLRLVPSKDKLTRGTFWVDTEAKRLWAQSIENRDLSAKSAIVEASVRPLIWSVEGAYVQTRGIRFRYASNPAQRGAATFAGRWDVVEDCVFEKTNGAGAQFRAEDIVVRRSEFSENGQLGFSANRAHRLLMSECLIRGNNTKNFNLSWEAGGDKLVLSKGVVIERSTFTGNHGNAIWFDIGNEDSTVRQCLIENNQDGGIFYEISYGLHAYDNVVIYNGLSDTPGAWGAQAGINLSSSPNCVIERNLLLGNREGFAFREQQRKTNRIDGEKDVPIWNHDEVIRDNVLAYNVSSQVAGWFDVADERCWPNRVTDLKLSFAQNIFAHFSGQHLVQWGPGWKRHQMYDKLADFQNELHLDTGSAEIDVAFADPIVRDFRLPAGHPALRAMPRGPVPGVRLGS